MSRSTNVYFIQTLARKIEDLNWRPRLGASLLGAFAFLALLLGAVGIYAVISYTVLQRRTEIGLRMALGARALGVLAMVLRAGLGLTVKGVLIGLIASLLATRALKGFLYGVSPGDPLTLASVSAILLAVASIACLAPALRVSRLNPGVVLKE